MIWNDLKINSNLAIYTNKAQEYYLDISTFGNFSEMFLVFESFIFFVISHTKYP